MSFNERYSIMDDLKRKYPKKFTSEDRAFSIIQRGNKIFIGTGAGEPKHLVRSLMDYLNRNPVAFFDADIFYLWTLNDNSDYFYDKYKSNFRKWVRRVHQEGPLCMVPPVNS
jgi:acyl-CoA hydrolase